MSDTASATSKPTIAVVGVSGSIGDGLLDALTGQFRDKYTMPVKALTRDANKCGPRENVVYYSTGDLTDVEVMKDALSGVDVLVDAVSSMVNRTGLIKAASEAGVKLVIPCLYSCENAKSRYKAFLPDPPVEQWEAGGAQTCCVLNCGFIRWFCENPAIMGLDISKGVYDIPGNGKEIVAWTLEEDIGKSIASLCHRPLNKIPKSIRIFGDIMTRNEVASRVEARIGTKLARVYTSEKDQFEKVDRMIRDPSNFGYVEFMEIFKTLPIEPEANYFTKVDNDLVNPGQTLWKWGKLSDMIDQTFSKR